EAESLGRHLPDEYVQGSDTTEAVTGEIPDPRTALVDPIDDATVSRLKQMLVGRFVVRDTALDAIPESRTPAQPFSLPPTTRPPPRVPARKSRHAGAARPARHGRARRDRVRGPVAGARGRAGDAGRLESRGRRGGDPAAGARAQPADQAGHARHAVLRGLARAD